jgi:hypothetical protein
VERIAELWGPPAWTVGLDWPAYPDALAASGLAVRDHQLLSVQATVDLRARLDCIQVVPTLQGVEAEEYLRHVDDYREAGIDLEKEPLVAVGGLGKRSGSDAAASIIAMLASRGLRLHGFGLKGPALRRLSADLSSSDSLAWSFEARREARRHPECEAAGVRHRNCANCLTYALAWRDRVLASAGTQPIQLPLTGTAS